MKLCITQRKIFVLLIIVSLSLILLLLGPRLNLGVLTPILPFVPPILGVIIGVIRHLRAWSKVPTLDFGSLYVNNEPAYFLRVRKSRGQGLAESCEAFLFVEGSNISNFPTVWSDGNVRRCDIGIYKDLRLFKVEKEHYEYATMKIPKSITFRKAKRTKGFNDERRSYSEFIEKKLTLKVTAKIGNIPKPFTKGIADIIKEAIPEPSLDTSVTSKYQITNDN